MIPRSQYSDMPSQMVADTHRPNVLMFIGMLAICGALTQAGTGHAQTGKSTSEVTSIPPSSGPPHRQPDEPATVPHAIIDGSQSDWRTLNEDDFELVNLQENTWPWEGNLARCTGQPIGVERSKEIFTNFELVAQWRHLSSGGNSGFFIWASPQGMQDLPPGELPSSGIEIQVLDNGFTEQYEQRSGKKGDWFTTHGDVFPVGTSTLKPFPPLSPNGARSFPTKQLSRPSPQWNHYYIRAIQGEVRLWVNGEEVSGGNAAQPATGHICLESEGAPVEFKDIRIRVLP